MVSFTVSNIMFINYLTEGLLFALLPPPTLTGTWVRQPQNGKKQRIFLVLLTLLLSKVHIDYTIYYYSGVLVKFFQT